MIRVVLSISPAHAWHALTGEVQVEVQSPPTLMRSPSTRLEANYPALRGKQFEIMRTLESGGRSSGSLPARRTCRSKPPR